MNIPQETVGYDRRDTDVLSFENDSQSQYDAKYTYDIGDLTLDTQREVKQLIKFIEDSYKKYLQTSFADLRYKINNRQFYVMFEPKLNTDALSDHKIPRSVLPILEPFVKDAHDEVAVALDAMLADLVVNSFGRTYKSEIDIKYKQYYMIDYLQIELRKYYTDSAVQLKIIESLYAQIINERYKYVKELYYVHEQAFYKARVGGKYYPDFSEATAQAQEVFSLPEIQSIDIMRSRSSKEPRVDNQRLKILAQYCAIMQKQLADYDATKQKVTTLQKKLYIAEDDLVDERKKLNVDIDSLTKQLSETKEQLRLSEVYARDAVSFMNLKIEENEKLLERLKDHDNLERYHYQIIQEYSKIKTRLDRANKDLDKTNVSLNERSYVAESEKNAILTAKDQEILDLKVENDQLAYEVEDLNKRIDELKLNKDGSSYNTSYTGEREIPSNYKTDRKSKKKLYPLSTDDFTYQFPEGYKSIGGAATYSVVVESKAPYFLAQQSTTQSVDMTPFKQEYEARKQITGFNWMSESVDDTMKHYLSAIYDFRSRIKGRYAKDVNYTDYLLNLFLAEYPDLKDKLTNLEADQTYYEDRRYTASDNVNAQPAAERLQAFKAQAAKLPPRPYNKAQLAYSIGDNKQVAQIYKLNDALAAAQLAEKDSSDNKTLEGGQEQYDEVVYEHFYPYEQLQFNTLNYQSITHSYSYQYISTGVAVDNYWERLQQLNQSLTHKKQVMDEARAKYYATLLNAQKTEYLGQVALETNYYQTVTYAAETLNMLENEMRRSCYLVRNEIEESRFLIAQTEKNKQGELTKQYHDMIEYYQRVVADCESDAIKCEQALATSATGLPVQARNNVVDAKAYQHNIPVDTPPANTNYQRAPVSNSVYKRGAGNYGVGQNVFVAYYQVQQYGKQYIPTEAQLHEHFVTNPLLTEHSSTGAYYKQTVVSGNVELKQAKKDDLKQYPTPKKQTVYGKVLSHADLLNMNYDATVSFEINPQDIISNHVANYVNDSLAMQIRFVTSYASSIYSDELVEVQEEMSEYNDDYIMQMIIYEENTRAYKLLSHNGGSDYTHDKASDNESYNKCPMPRFSSKYYLTVLLGGHVDVYESFPPIGPQEDKKELIVNALKDYLFAHIFNAEPTSPGQISYSYSNFDYLLLDNSVSRNVLAGEQLSQYQLQIIQSKVMNPQTIKTIAERVPYLNDATKKVVQTLYSRSIRDYLQNGNFSPSGAEVLKHLFFNNDLIDVMAGNSLVVKNFIVDNYSEQQIKYAVKSDELLEFQPAYLAADLYNCLETAKMQDIYGYVAYKLQQLVSDDTELCLSAGDDNIRRVGLSIADILSNPAVLQRLLYYNIDKATAKKLYMLLDQKKLYNLRNGELSADEIRQIIDYLADPKIASLFVGDAEYRKLSLNARLLSRKYRFSAAAYLNAKAYQILDPKVAAKLASGELDYLTCNALLRVLGDKYVADLFAESTFSAECEAKISAILYNPDVIKEVKQGGAEAAKMLAYAIYDPEVVSVLSYLLRKEDARVTAKLCSDVLRKPYNRKNVLNPQPFSIETSVVRGQEALRNLEEQYKVGTRGEIQSNIKISQNVDRGYTSKPITPAKRSPYRRESTTYQRAVFYNEKQAPSFIRSYYLPTNTAAMQNATSTLQKQPPQLQQRVNNIRYTYQRKASPKNVACCIVGIANTPVRVNTGPVGGRYNYLRKEQIQQQTQKLEEKNAAALEDRTTSNTPQARAYSQDAPQYSGARLSFMMELPYKPKEEEDGK